MSTLEAPGAALGEMVNTSRYPLADPDGAEAKEIVAQARRGLEADGCTVLPDFVHPSLRETLRTECADFAPAAYTRTETVNVYNMAASPDLPADHPGRIPFERGNSFVARDRIPSKALISRLYAHSAFRRFVADCFGLQELHELADPFSALVLNVVEPGMEHPWHFDTNEFTVSLLTQEAEEGGVFEYCPGIRSAQDENFADVRSVIEGRGDGLVKRLPLHPGDLQLFKGRYALHRVSAVRGGTPRHSAIFAYSERPGVVGSVSRTRQLFGRVRPEHLAAEGRAVRGDQLLD
ncbi:arpA protein [Streptomyces sp. ODS28]|uniref:HalD/BesD family halogenase n=1 Tax=Streptomyces sp. ODS28 TaxID=3136688 RepID=UPI0031E73030